MVYGATVNMNFSWIRLFFFIFLLDISPKVLAEEDPKSSCIQSLLTIEQKSELIDQVFKDSFFNPDIYSCYYCNRNVVRLFQQIKLAYPEIEADEIRVLYISTKNNVNKLLARESVKNLRNFQVKKARDGYINGQSHKVIAFPFHVVLEFNGRIYDLDFTDQPTPISSQDYLNEFFLSDNIQSNQTVTQADLHEDLIVYVVPGLRYLTTPEDFTLKMWFHLSIFARFEPMPLVDYLTR